MGRDAEVAISIFRAIELFYIDKKELLKKYRILFGGLKYSRLIFVMNLKAIKMKVLRISIIETNDLYVIILVLFYPLMKQLSEIERLKKVFTLTKKVDEEINN
jgi:hypothetical protein